MELVRDEEQLHTFETLRAYKEEAVKILLDGIANDQNTVNKLYALLFDCVSKDDLFETLKATVEQSVRDQV